MFTDLRPLALVGGFWRGGITAVAVARYRRLEWRLPLKRNDNGDLTDTYPYAKKIPVP